MDQKLSKIEEFKQELANMPLDDISYILGRYCGPYNKLLAEKKYGHEISKQITRLVNEELFSRSVDEMLLSDSE